MTGRPPMGRSWAGANITPTVGVSGRSRGRLSVAGLLCVEPNLPTRLCYRLRRRTGRKGERRSLGENDYIRLLDGAHQLLKVRRRLKALQYQHSILGGFLAGTGLTLDRPNLPLRRRSQ
ncbi:transposase [Streptomyces avermitilis]|uniref:transposase n=1 Tax=Streptomyces avermitilis TaxID=33903 RepID=UPI0036CF6704